MRKNYESSNSSNNKSYMLKVFTVKSNYLKYLRKNDLEEIATLEGKVINDIPFVNAYLKECVCRIEHVELQEKSIKYKLDFQRDKIIHDNNLPLRVIYHEKVEVIHYYKNGMAVIYYNNNTVNIDALYIIMTLSYWAILRNNQSGEIYYSKPIINEINIDFMKDFEFFRSFLFQYVECDAEKNNLQVFRLNENFWERDKRREVYELKLFRKHHIKYYFINKNGEKKSILIKANGEVESTIPLEIDILERFVNILELLILKIKPFEFPENMENYLEQWIDLLSKDMEQEFKIKKKLNVVNDLKNLLYEAQKYDVEEINNGILALSIYMKELITLCINAKDTSFRLEYIDSIEYDTLCDFLKRYVKEKYCINLSELELTYVLNRFYLELREAKVHLLTSCVQYDTLENNKP